MRAAVVVDAGALEMAEVPEPEPDPYQALVRTLAGGLCGTDRHIVQGTFYRRDYPAILGHESIGEVVEVGDRVRNLSVGDLVLRTAAVRPGERLGPYASILGGFSEWAIAADVGALSEAHPTVEVHPYDHLQKIVPAGFDPIDAGAFIALKETLSWLRRVSDPSGRRVLIIGAGSAGLAFVQVARLLGASQVIVVGRRQGRLEHARRLGADEVLTSSPNRLPEDVRRLTDGHGVDLVIEAAGTSELLAVVPDALAKGGVVGVYGVSATQAAMINWGWDRPAPRSWSLRFEEPDEAGIHAEALDLVRTGTYDLKSTLTHVYPFDQILEAVDAMGREEACKVAIDFRDTALPR